MGQTLRQLSELESLVVRTFTRRTGFKLLPSLLTGWSFAQEAPDAALCAAMLQDIPPRAPDALTGSQFSKAAWSMDRHERERAILLEFVQGNIPSFLRKLVPVQLAYRQRTGETTTATIFAMPDYVAIGSNADFLRIPMTLHTATAIADRFGCVLPTRRIVDVIYNRSASHFTPHPLPPGPQMVSTKYYTIHNAIIENESHTRGFRLGTLVAGHKKDVVITNMLNRIPGRIAIYGWHRATGVPIQPLSTVHGAGYVDYSHGIRLIAGRALVGDQMRSVYELLEDFQFSRALSDEGPIQVSSTLCGA